jgi:hypothetical protein
MCVLCPEGTYQPLPGKTSCKKCPKGSTSSADRGQCVRANGAPATKMSLLEIEAEGDADEVLPHTPITPGKKFSPKHAENPVEKLKQRVADQE